MCSRVDELKAILSSEERGAIAEIGQVCRQPEVSFGMAERLMRLGLAEVNCGRLDLTVAGRQVLETMGGR